MGIPGAVVLLFLFLLSFLLHQPEEEEEQEEKVKSCRKGEKNGKKRKKGVGRRGWDFISFCSMSSLKDQSRKSRTGMHSFLLTR